MKGEKCLLKESFVEVYLNYLFLSIDVSLLLVLSEEGRLVCRLFYCWATNF